MKENIDLTKILKDCPKGTKLYSTIFGEVKFVNVNNLYQIIVSIEDKYYYFTPKGVFIFQGIIYHNGECVLFPSENQRDWSKFTAPLYKNEKFDPKTLKPFDKVLVRDSYNYKWVCDLFSFIVDDDAEYKYRCIGSCSKYCIPYNNDTKHLVGTYSLPSKYYRYWQKDGVDC